VSTATKVPQTRDMNGGELFYGLAVDAQLEAARAGGLPSVRPDPGA